ncbi:MAG: shikimate dehydrogenase [Pseudomonadota bacterium]
MIAPTDPPIQAGVIGDPIAHSLSPQIHTYWCRKYGIDGEYQRIHVRPHELEYRLIAIRDQGFAGINVTLPHKVAIRQFLNSETDRARAIGAVNLITFNETGAHGDNSDGIGAFTHLKSVLQENDRQIAEDRPVIIYGAGGAARAMSYQWLISTRAPLILINRTRKRANELVSRLSEISDFRPRLTARAPDELSPADYANAQGLINATVLGMHGETPLRFQIGNLAPDAFVYDLVYTPLETPLLAAVRARGQLGIDGLGMLLHQAVPAFDAFFGVRPMVDEDLRAHVIAALNRPPQL